MCEAVYGRSYDTNIYQVGVRASTTTTDEANSRNLKGLVVPKVLVWLGSEVDNNHEHD